jgi:hypothetical protein
VDIHVFSFPNFIWERTCLGDYRPVQKASSSFLQQAGGLPAHEPVVEAVKRPTPPEWVLIWPIPAGIAAAMTPAGVGPLVVLTGGVARCCGLNHRLIGFHPLRDALTMGHGHRRCTGTWIRRPYQRNQDRSEMNELRLLLGSVCFAFATLVACTTFISLLCARSI